MDPATIIPGVIAMILSLSVHEWAHAQVAWWFGDDTAERQGRLTLNPMAHIDPLGTIVLPILGSISGVPVIGWAKPVPVNPVRFRRNVHMRTGMALVAFAGPFSNLLLALISATLLSLLTPAMAVQKLLHIMFYLNVGLFVFNLLPIIPLDGSRLLPRSLDKYQDMIAPYSQFVLMGVVMIPFLNEYLVRTPVNFLASLIKMAVGL